MDIVNKAPSSKPKAIIMGIDKIITDVNPWFKFLSELDIDWEKEQKMYDLLKEGKARWEELKDKMIPIPKDDDKRIQKSRFDSTVGNIEINPESKATVEELHRRGYVLCIVSGSIDLIVQSIADRLHIVDWYANTALHFDYDGYWTDIEYQQAESGLKLEQAQHFQRKYSFKSNEIVMVGHSHADIELFQEFPAIAINVENPELRELAWEEIDQFPKILEVLDHYE